MVNRRPNTICVSCGKALYRTPSNIKKSKTGSYCKDCWGSWRKNKGSWNSGKKERYDIVCKYCGNHFKTISSRLNKSKYCSNKCYTESGKRGGNINTGKHWTFTEEQRNKKGKLQKGKKNPNWKGGITNKRKNSDSVLWARYIKKRDKHCMICGSYKKLCAHHIEGFNHNKELRYDYSNGITLCEECHNSFHNKYGRGDNNREQYDKWINSHFKKINKITHKVYDKSKVYNICLEDDSSFFANGILTHNTPNPTSPEELREWITKKLFDNYTGKDREAAIQNATERIANNISLFGPRPRPFLRPTLHTDLPKIINNNISRLSD